MGEGIHSPTRLRVSCAPLSLEGQSLRGSRKQMGRCGVTRERDY